MTVNEYLQTAPLLFDGAMGTYYAARFPDGAARCEDANLRFPEQIREIHRAYLDAGCRALKTNTFGLNRPNVGETDCAALLAAGYQLAKEVAGDRAFVFADMGPVSAAGDIHPEAEYRFLADQFLALGAENFLFETLCDDAGISEISAYIKGKKPDAFILVSFAALPDGYTRSGIPARELIARARADQNIDATGLNCVSGARHMAALIQKLEPSEKPLSAMPNAGYPTVLGNRTFYRSDPDYFALQLAELAASGVRLLGGCCGTTPDYLAAAARAIASPARSVAVPVPAVPKREEKVPTPFYDALCDPAQKPFAVELDPPAAADTAKFMKGAKELQEKGASVITIADCPIARARMDSSILACKLRRELGMEVLPHMTCRDRNLNAIKALLLGLCAEDVHNVLVITGDPIPSASRDEVKSVYNFNSRMLARYVSSLNETDLPVPFHIFGALNVNARNFSVQLSLAKQKLENGVCGFLTQPVLTAQALENLKLAREALDGKILGGIIPVVSHRNALFMNSEVAGISVAPEIIRLYEGADREKGEELAVRISTAIAKEIAPYVDGYYLMTPFGRTGLMGRIMDEIRRQDANQ